MRSSTAIFTFLLSLALLVAPSSVGAEPEPEPEAKGEAAGVWVYDIRFVRVDTTTADVVETAPAWQAEDRTTVALSFKDLLASLKARGKTTVLLDQRVTAVADSEVQVRDSRDRQIAQLQRADRTNTTYQSSTVQAGSSVKLKNMGRILSYHVEVKWELPRREGDMRPLLGTAQWSGAHPLLTGGSTLFLTHRKQVAYENQEPVGIEFYAFVSGRLLGQ